MKKIIYLSAIIFSALFFIQASIPYQDKTIVEGRVTDIETGESILFGTVTFFQEGKLIKETKTDLDGKYQIEIEPNIYDIEASYMGYTTIRKKDFKIKAGIVNQLNLAISEGVSMTSVEIMEYKVPLIEIDNTTTGATLTSEDIKSLPTRNINSIAASVPGLHSENTKNEIKTNQYIPENKFQSPFRAPLSTIPMDIDPASYSTIRSHIAKGNLPPENVVRIEEMINYFNYDYPTPEAKTRPLKVFSQLTVCPWNSENKLLHIGIQGKEIHADKIPASNLDLIDQTQETKKTLVSELEGTIHTIAKNVNVKVEFNPTYVSKYRLIGYENRKKKDLEVINDANDTGELKTGHSVTVLYEITPNRDKFVSVEDKLKYQKRSTELMENNELGTVLLRYRTPTGYKVWEFEEKINSKTTPFDEVEDKTKHAAAIAELGMLLKDSNYKADASYSNVEVVLKSLESDKYLKSEVLSLLYKIMDLVNVK